jgi:salicylate hydroxylase
LHSGKKLATVVEDGKDGSLELHFEDSSVVTVDALIGADGIFGFVRRQVLDEKDAASAAGWWDCRNVVPYEKAKTKLGSQYFVEPRQYGWVGEKAFIMHDILDDGKSVQCVCSATEETASTTRNRDLSRSFLEKSFEPWLDGPIARNMIDVCMNDLKKLY